MRRRVLLRAVVEAEHDDGPRLRPERLRMTPPVRLFDDPVHIPVAACGNELIEPATRELAKIGGGKADGIKPFLRRDPSEFIPVRRAIGAFRSRGRHNEAAPAYPADCPPEWDGSSAGIWRGRTRFSRSDAAPTGHRQDSRRWRAGPPPQCRQG